MNLPEFDPRYAYESLDEIRKHAVVDPDFASLVRRHLEENLEENRRRAEKEDEWRRRASTVDKGLKIAGYLVFFASLISMLILLWFHVAAGFPLPWVLAMLIPAGIGAYSAESARARERINPYLGRSLAPIPGPSPQPNQIVEYSQLNDEGRDLLMRASEAIKRVMQTGVYENNLVYGAADEPKLRHVEFEIAWVLAKLAELGKADSHHSEAASPMTLPLLEPHFESHSRLRANMLSITESRVQKIECCAQHAEAFDAIRRDLETVQASIKALSELNDRYLDVVARATGDEHAIEEINELTDKAKAAAKLFEDSLRKLLEG